MCRQDFIQISFYRFHLPDIYCAFYEFIDHQIDEKFTDKRRYSIFALV